MAGADSVVETLSRCGCIPIIGDDAFVIVRGNGNPWSDIGITPAALGGIKAAGFGYRQILQIEDYGMSRKGIAVGIDPAPCIHRGCASHRNACAAILEGMEPRAGSGIERQRFGTCQRQVAAAVADFKKLAGSCEPPAVGEQRARHVAECAGDVGAGGETGGAGVGVEDLVLRDRGHLRQRRTT